MLYAYGYKMRGKNKYIIWGLGETKLQAYRDMLFFTGEWGIYKNRKKNGKLRAERKRCKVFTGTPGLRNVVDGLGGCNVPARFIKELVGKVEGDNNDKR